MTAAPKTFTASFDLKSDALSLLDPDGDEIMWVVVEDVQVANTRLMEAGYEVQRTWTLPTLSGDKRVMTSTWVKKRPSEDEIRAAIAALLEAADSPKARQYFRGMAINAAAVLGWVIGEDDMPFQHVLDARK